MNVVDLSKVKKELRKLPKHIKTKLQAWVESVELSGIRVVRKLPGYHDEPLQGKRWGQRSIRLSRSYRAIYTERRNGELSLLIIEEVNKHDY